MKKKEKEVMKVIGMLLIAFAVIDFVASYQGINLTPFLGDFSRFSPIIIGFNWSGINEKLRYSRC